jgi:hypothetical protein
VNQSEQKNLLLCWNAICMLGSIFVIILSPAMTECVEKPLVPVVVNCFLQAKVCISNILQPVQRVEPIFACCQQQWSSVIENGLGWQKTLTITDSPIFRS